jgi:hypothetical protein
VIQRFGSASNLDMVAQVVRSARDLISAGWWNTNRPRTRLDFTVMMVEMEDMRLARRPEAAAPSVERLLEWIADGRVRVPRFQRPLRWRSKHVVAFFDSLYRGFPVGELLLSRQDAPKDALVFGSRRVAAPARHDAFYVIDGQQRITALAGALLHPDDVPHGDIHAIWFDLEARSFERLVVAEAPIHWIPLNVVADSARLLGWLNRWALRAERPDLVQAAIELGKAVREYQVPTYIVEGASEAVLRRIFKRTNTSGVAMTEAEVFDALHAEGESEPLKDACRRLEEEGFGPIDPSWFLRCVKAVGGIDPRRKFTDVEDRVASSAWGNAETAMRRAIGFLVGDAGIPHGDLLPYRLPLVVLARFFHVHPRPSVRARTLLVHWIWRGALSGDHAQSSQGTVDDLCGRIGLDESRSIEALLSTVPRSWEAPDPRAVWNGRSASTRLLALAMWARGPRDPDTGAPFSVADLQNLEAPLDAFPDVFVRKKSTPIARHVAMIAADAGRLEDKLHRFTYADREVLATHLVDGTLLRDGSAESITEARARALADWADRFFRERSGIADNDRPSIAALLDRVEKLASTP